MASHLSFMNIIITTIIFVSLERVEKMIFEMLVFAEYLILPMRPPEVGVEVTIFKI